MDSKSVSYRRQRAKGLLKLGAAVDIFEASNLHATARLAFQDEKATTVCIDLSHLEKLDLTAIQILLALRNDLRASGRAFESEGMSPEIKERLDKLGISMN